MANQEFVGAVASQHYRWGYICEFCGKEVEKQGSVSVQQGHMQNITTHSYISRSDAETMKEQIRLQLAGSVSEMDRNIAQGHFDIPKDSGQCPFCKKYQHWSNAATNARIGIGGGGNGCLIGLATGMIGPLVGLGLALLVTFLMPNAKELSSVAKTLSFVIPLLLGILIVFLVTLLLMRRSKMKQKAENEALKREMEKVAKTEPHFISWTDQTCELKGMRIS